MIPVRPRWMDRASCATTPKDVFYPDQIGVPEQKAYREARKICACLCHAAKRPEVYGAGKKRRKKKGDT